VKPSDINVIVPKDCDRTKVDNPSSNTSDPDVCIVTGKLRKLPYISFMFRTRPVILLASGNCIRPVFVVVLRKTTLVDGDTIAGSISL
jgi:hypothetical protein